PAAIHRCRGRSAQHRLELVRVGQPRATLALQLLRDQAGVDQLAAQILGQCTRIALIVYDVRGDEHQQFSALARVALGRNYRAEDRDVLEEGYPAVIIRDIIADQAGHPDRLAVLDSHSRAERLIVESWRAHDRVRRSDVPHASGYPG